jgi:hypothetical protein
MAEFLSGLDIKVREMIGKKSQLLPASESHPACLNQAKISLMTNF